MGTRRFLAISTVAATALVGLAGVVWSAPAQAQQSQVPSNDASAWQTNGTVWAIAYAAGNVYVGGDFTSVRPPGAAAGSGEVARNHLAVFSASTGALVTSINRNVNATVKVLTASPNGQTVYAGGDFSAIDGVTRNRLAALTASTGAVTGWAPSANARVSSIAATASTVYVGGAFSTAGGRASQRLAALNASTGVALTTFTATADNVVYQMALSSDNSQLYLAGGFLSVNGDTNYHAAAAISASTGANLPFAAGSVIPAKTAGCVVEVKSVKTDANGAYFGSEGTGGGCFDGTFAVNADGSLKWRSGCLGATQAVQPINGTLFTGSHSHDCTSDQGADPDAFPEVGWAKGLARFLLSRSTSGGVLGSWYPNTNGGTGLGPRVMATDGSQLFVGGEFTTVNGHTQQGFTRFSPATGDLAVPAAPVAPSAVARAGGKVSVYVQSPLDTDDPDLLARLYRDGGSTPIAAKPVHSLFWRQPIIGFSDDGLAVGSQHTYRVDFAEANGSNVGAKSAASPPVQVVSAVPNYAASVMSANPTLFWRMSDTHAPAVADSSNALEGGTSFGGVTFGQPGVTADSSTAISTDGVSGIVSSTDSMPSPTSYSIAAWFKTTSTTGGKIIGFGDRQKGYDFSGNPALSGSYDKHVYMTNDGHVIFGVYNNGFDDLTTPTALNDGQWHYAVATQGSSGMAFYVDGVRVGRNTVTTNQSYTGYWRVGGDNLGAWPNQPTSNYFSGSIDEVAVFSRPLALSEVQAQYTASGRPAPPSTSPTDAYGRAVAGDSPSIYWRMDEAGPSTAADASDNGNTGLYTGGVTYSGPSSIGSFGHSAGFDGTSGGVALGAVRNGPGAYSTELWFKTSTTTGGKLVGFGDAQTGASSAYDKQVYMTDDGHLLFGVYNGGFDTLRSDVSLNDDQWHHVVATQDASGMALYVDDHVVGSNAVTASQSYNGYWRVGGDNLNAWPEQPTSSYFGGSIDEVAIYDAALTPAQVDAHYAASGRSGPDMTAPVTAITAPAPNAVLASGPVTVTATASDDVAVTSVALLVDGAVVDSDTTAPYTFSWTATDGEHMLRTVAHDAAGNAGQSAIVTVTASTPDTVLPTTAITSPADGDTVYGPTSVTATATDNVGVVSVALSVDGTVVATDTSSPYTFTWNATDQGKHTLRSVAKDAAGNTATSDGVGITVKQPADSTPPTAPGSLTAAATSATSVTLKWSAATDDRAVTGYRIVRNGTALPDAGSDTTYVDTGVSPATAYVYTVSAFDAAGNVGAASDPASTTTPALSNTLFSDDWSGPNGAGWSSSWTTSADNGSATIASGGGALQFKDVASAYARAQLTGVGARQDTELTMSYRFDSTATGAYLNVFLRGSGGWQSAYRPRSGYGLQLAPNSAAVTVQKNVNGTLTNIATVAAGQQVTTAKQWLRLRVSGQTIEFKTWLDSGNEPTAWKSVQTDSSVTTAGQLFISQTRAANNTGARGVTVDDLKLASV